MRSALLVLICMLGTTAVLAKEKPAGIYTIPLPAKPDFSALEWLVGEWTGKTTGRGAQGEIQFAAAYDLEKRFLILREQVRFPATAAAPASSESWLGILSGSRSLAGFVLRTFSSTGFMARYRVTVEGAEIRFYPEGGEEVPPGWLFRRVLVRVGDAEFTQTVQVAPPNKPFFDHYTAKLTRKPAN